MKKINVSSAHSATRPGLWGRMEPRREGVLAGSGLAGVLSAEASRQQAGRRTQPVTERETSGLGGIQQILKMAPVSRGATLWEGRSMD